MKERRQFTDWSRPALHGAVELLARQYAAADELDLRGCTIVLPGARAGRRLKELLVDTAAQRGLRLLPPRVTTPGHLPELLYTPALPAADEALCLRTWARVLRLARPELLHLLFSRPPAPGDLRRYLALARTLARLHETVAGAMLSFRDVAARCGDSLLFDDGARWTALADLQDAYSVALKDTLRSDRDLARIAALRCGPIATDSDIWLIGIADMPLVVRRMLARLATEVHPVVHAPVALAHAFDDIGCVDAAWWSRASLPLDAAELSLVERPADQAHTVVHAIAGLDRRFAVDDIVVGVPDEELVPYIEERLAGAGVPARHAQGSAIEAAPPYRLLAAVADVLDGDSAEAWAALARHPDLQRWIAARGGEVDSPGAAALRRGDWIVQLDDYHAAHVPDRLGAALPGAGAPAVEALLAALRSPALLGALRGRRPLGEWMPRLMDLLLHVYGTRPLDRDVPHERRLLAACTALRDAASALNRVPADSDDVCDAPTAIRIMLDDVRGATVPAEQAAAAVELLGWLELHLDDAPVAVITGANEPFLPASVTADAFLPDSLRSTLHIEDSARRYARDAYQLRAIVESRQHVYIVAGRRSAAGDPLRPSRLLLALTGEPLARRVANFYGGTATDADAAATAAAAAATAATAATAAATGRRAPDARPAIRASRFVLPPQPLLGAAAPIEKLRVTAFRTLLQDRYGFALEHVLRLREADDSARELDPMLFGSLAHSVLETFGRSAAAHTDDRAAVTDRLHAILDREVQTGYGRNVRPAVRLQVEQLRARLAAFAQWQTAWYADGWRTVGVECGTPDEGVPFDVDGEPFRLTGKIDRIDRHDVTGEWAVFDYKTGERGHTPEQAHRKGRGDSAEWIDLQLPLYRHILPHVSAGDGVRVFAGPVDDVRLGYITLCADSALVTGNFADWDVATLASADEAARDCVRVLRRNVFEFAGAPRGVTGDHAALLGVGRLSLIADGDDE
jgi:ATP-dependent helicase/nuclease subunit B